eukprot:GDKI01047629.1.p1 GENE.GDKI01047629.1~~GDKI01047629.1.p1  ORF type:complete len:111 (+),score=7.22 GDKI01047629.1:43-333(+)
MFLNELRRLGHGFACATSYFEYPGLFRQCTGNLSELKAGNTYVSSQNTRLQSEIDNFQVQRGVTLDVTPRFARLVERAICIGGFCWVVTAALQRKK